MTIKGCTAFQKAEMEEVVFHLRENHGKKCMKYTGQVQET